MYINCESVKVFFIYICQATYLFHVNRPTLLQKVIPTDNRLYEKETKTAGRRNLGGNRLNAALKYHRAVICIYL